MMISMYHMASVCPVLRVSSMLARIRAASDSGRPGDERRRRRAHVHLAAARAVRLTGNRNSTGTRAESLW